MNTATAISISLMVGGGGVRVIDRLMGLLFNKGPIKPAHKAMSCYLPIGGDVGIFVDHL